MSGTKATDYEISKEAPSKKLEAPLLPYQPRDPETYRPRIGMIACGGITEHHLKAYVQAGYNVVALCDLREERALKRQKQFYPGAQVYTDYRDVLARDDIEVVDIATHPPERLPLIEAALMAGKHVLSQKPFVLDIDAGKRLVDLADKQGVRLAVNQNGRWAPHFAYIHRAVHAGLIGDVISAHCDLHWDHSWIMGTPFEDVDDIILYDFAIHWFDFLSFLLKDVKLNRVYASRSRAAGQKARPPMMGQAQIEFEGGQASLVFDANVPYGGKDYTYIGGTKGSITSEGDRLSAQTVTIYNAEGSASPTLQGSWFPDGFHGSMAELLCAIEENREPTNSAHSNLRSLELCFAAIQSAHDGNPQTPGDVRKLPPGAAPATMRIIDK